MYNLCYKNIEDYLKEAKICEIIIMAVNTPNRRI